MHLKNSINGEDNDMWKGIWAKIKEVFKRMLGNTTLEQKLNVAPAISTDMRNAIELWTNMYQDKADWLKEPTTADPVRVVSLGLPAMIASEKARMVVLELKSDITTPVETVTKPNPNYTAPKEENGEIKISPEPEYITKETPIGDTARAEYLNEQYQTKILSKLRNIVELMIAKGGFVIKPYVVVNNAQVEGEEITTSMEFDFVHADMFFPLAFDSTGKLIDAAFLQVKPTADFIYYRIERHTLNGTTCTIQNMAFKKDNIETSSNSNELDLGQSIALSEVPEWKDFAPQAVIQNVKQLLFTYIKMPEANTIDPHSPLGVSGFSRAVSLIKEADKQYSRMLWEFEGGELAIDIDRDALTTEIGSDGKKFENRPIMQQRLFRKVDLNDSSTYEVFNPNFRDDSLVNGLNTILKRIEDVCALSRGTLSEVNNDARTATELKILKQRSYSANAEIQKQVELGLKDLIYVMDVYCTLYNITPPGEYEVSFEWDDSILVDVNEELNKKITLMQNGLMSDLEVRMWYCGETEAQAMEALEKIRQQKLKDAEQSMMVDNDIGGF